MPKTKPIKYLFLKENEFPESHLVKGKKFSFGGRLSFKDLQEINEQVNFALKIFEKEMTPELTVYYEKKLKKFFSKNALSINTALKEKNGSEEQQKRNEIELFNYMKKTGNIYMGLIDNNTGKIYLRKNFSMDRKAVSTPLHEILHMLQKKKVIEIDVPFAQAADRLYALEKGFIKPTKKIRMPKIFEFDRIPKKETDSNELREPNWSYPLGNRISQWIYINLPADTRWNYIYLRCKGKTHSQALKELNFVNA